MVVEGTLILMTKDSPDAPEEHLHMTKGTFIRTPKGVAHAFHAITPVTAVVMLTKRWDDCDQPIVKVDYLGDPSKARP